MSALDYVRDFDVLDRAGRAVYRYENRLRFREPSWNDLPALVQRHYRLLAQVAIAEAEGTCDE